MLGRRGQAGFSDKGVIADSLGPKSSPTIWTRRNTPGAPRASMSIRDERDAPGLLKTFSRDLLRHNVRKRTFAEIVNAPSTQQGVRTGFSERGRYWRRQVGDVRRASCPRSVRAILRSLRTPRSVITD